MLSLLQARPTLILTIHQYEHRVRDQLEQFKAVVELVDSSRLHINEVWLSGLLHKYAYYWLTPTGTLVQGWDNAPHHPQLTTYPHYSHMPTGIEPSSARSLADALTVIEQCI
ncbi:MAG: DUF6516 family protein [Caldilineaceae bacterium]